LRDRVAYFPSTKRIVLFLFSWKENARESYERRTMYEQSQNIARLTIREIGTSGKGYIDNENRRDAF